MRRTLMGMGAIALAGAVALGGCQATQTRAESGSAQTTEATPAPSPEALYGGWRGRWDGGGGDIAITIVESGDTKPDVTYCFGDRCGDPADIALDGATLTFTAGEGGLKYTFKPEGDRLRATLKKGGRTFRALMKRE